MAERMLDALLGLDAPPTAIVCSMDAIALHVLQKARERGLRIPRDLSVTGYGDVEYTPFTEPPLTTVRIDQRALGEVGARLLLGRIGQNYVPTHTLIRPQLISRKSCSPPLRKEKE